jgi:hypothetical protein
MKVVGKSFAFYKNGIGIDDQTKVVFRFFSVFSVDFRSHIVSIDKISNIIITKLQYSHYTGGQSYRGNISAYIENKNTVFDLELICDTLAIAIVKRNKDKELVNKYANFLSENLGLEIELRKVGLNKYQSNNLSRQINDK